jgi:uncharacterized phiE125 gp8 family phage protein
VAHFDRLVRVAAPEAGPLSLADAKAHLRVDTADEDVGIAAMIDQAVGEIDGPRGSGLCLITQTWLLSLDCFEWRIRIPLGPNVEIVSVKYLDPDGAEITLAADQYQLAAGQDPAILSPAYNVCWPQHLPVPGAVRIEFTAGFGAAADAVPADLVGALKLIVASLYEDRENGGVPPSARHVINRYAPLGVA